MRNGQKKDLKKRNRKIGEILKQVYSLELSHTPSLKKGIKIIDQDLQLRDDIDTDLLHLKGGLLEILGNYQEAAVIYRRILRLIPNHLSATFDLGDACQNLGEFRKALIYYNRALRLIDTGTGHKGRLSFDVKGENFLHVVEGKARTLLALKRPTESLKCIVNALQFYPADIRLSSCLEEAQEQFHRIKSK